MNMCRRMLASLVGSGLAVSLALAPRPAHPQAAPAEPPRTISTNGEAEVRVKPDEVVLTFGVETVNTVLQAAKDANDAITRKALAVAERLGVPGKDIQTDYFTIEPRYESEYPRRNFIGYFVRKTMVITLRKPDMFESLLSAELQAGINTVQGVQFRTTELRKYRDQARTLAVRAAREKAELLAKELGSTVGLPRTVSEYGGGWWYPYNAGWYGRGANSMAQNSIQNAGPSGDGPSGDSTLALGQITVNAGVQVTFDLAP